jgi:hypothetical protein
VLALDREGVELVVIHRDVGVLGVFVAAALGLALDRLTSDFVDQLLSEAVAGLLVDLAERDTLGRRSPGVEGSGRDNLVDVLAGVALALGAWRSASNASGNASRNSRKLSVVKRNRPSRSFALIRFV